MSWTVACFCGNVYTAPPDRCAVCGCSIDGADSGDLATEPAVGRRRGARPLRAEITAARSSRNQLSPPSRAGSPAEGRTLVKQLLSGRPGAEVRDEEHGDHPGAGGPLRR